MFLANRNWDDIVRDYESMQPISGENKESSEESSSSQNVCLSNGPRPVSTDESNDHVSIQGSTAILDV